MAAAAFWSVARVIEPSVVGIEQPVQRSAALGILLNALFAWACYRTASVWPAVWFHAVHNLLSQNPALFEGGQDPLWLGESGLLPLAGYSCAAAVVLWFGREASRERRGQC